MKLYANLHSHSTHSDGVYSPTELVKVAKAEGYKAIALSDHDIGTGYPEFKAACEKEGIGLTQISDTKGQNMTLGLSSKI